jgi:hypothetical protein
MSEEYELDSEGNKFPKREESTKSRMPTESPYDCIECGKPANSPKYKNYCWDCYDKHSDGRAFD